MPVKNCNDSDVISDFPPTEENSKTEGGKTRKLTPEDLLIILEYLNNGFVKGAAYKKYHPNSKSEKSVYNQSSTFFARSEVKRYISDFVKKVQTKKEITAERTLRELSEVGYAKVEGKVTPHEKTEALKVMGEFLKMDDPETEIPLGDTIVTNIIKLVLPDNGIGNNK
jgi:hypothetical protein